MPTVGIRNSEAQAIGSTDHLSINDRNFSAEWYDSVGGGLFIGATQLALGTVRHNSAPEIFNMASNTLTILEAGLYLFNFSVTVTHVATSETIWLTQLEEDPDTGVFAVVNGTQTYNTFFIGQNSASNMAILRVGIDYRYRIRTSRIGGADGISYVANSSKFSVMRLFKNG